MQLIGVLILLGILVLLLVFAAYLARRQKSKNQPYGSWSNVLGPQFRGSAFDVGEKLNSEIEAGRQQQPRRVPRAHHTKRKNRKLGLAGPTAGHKPPLQLIPPIF